MAGPAGPPARLGNRPTLVNGCPQGIPDRSRLGVCAGSGSSGVVPAQGRHSEGGLLPHAVAQARDQDLTWDQIGALLGLTGPAAARRYRPTTTGKEA